MSVRARDLKIGSCSEGHVVLILANGDEVIAEVHLDPEAVPAAIVSLTSARDQALLVRAPAARMH